MNCVVLLFGLEPLLRYISIFYSLYSLFYSEQSKKEATCPSALPEDTRVTSWPITALTSFDCCAPPYITHMGHKLFTACRASGGVHQQRSGSCDFTVHLTLAFCVRNPVSLTKNTTRGKEVGLRGGSCPLSQLQLEHLGQTEV